MAALFLNMIKLSLISSNWYSSFEITMLFRDVFHILTLIFLADVNDAKVSNVHLKTMGHQLGTLSSGMDYAPLPGKTLLQVIRSN